MSHQKIGIQSSDKKDSNIYVCECSGGGVGVCFHSENDSNIFTQNSELGPGNAKQVVSLR